MTTIFKYHSFPHILFAITSMVTFSSVCYLCFSAGLPQLIFTNGGDVMIADLHGRIVRILVPSQGKGLAVAVAYSWHNDKVFWSDTYTKKVSLNLMSDEVLDYVLLLFFIQQTLIQNFEILLPGLFRQLLRRRH